MIFAGKYWQLFRFLFGGQNFAGVEKHPGCPTDDHGRTDQCDNRVDPGNVPDHGANQTENSADTGQGIRQYMEVGRVSVIIVVPGFIVENQCANNIDD